MNIRKAENFNNNRLKDSEQVSREEDYLNLNATFKPSSSNYDAIVGRVGFEPPKMGIPCWETSNCAADEFCYGGYCVKRPGLDDGSGGPNPGDCELPDPTEEDKECGGGATGAGDCYEAGCGEPGSEINGEDTKCEEKEEEEGDGNGGDGSDPIFDECIEYAHEYYMTYEEIPPGYTRNDICPECQHCKALGAGTYCQDLDVDDSDFHCKCFKRGGSCANENGVCFDCNQETGQCEKTCKNCTTQCNRFFVCPCDTTKTYYEAFGNYSPCEDNLSFGPGGTCWQRTQKRIEDFCTEQFGNGCGTDECFVWERIRTPYPDPCENRRPEDACRDQGFIKNEETGEIIYMADYGTYRANSACRCNSGPDSSFWRTAGSAQYACGSCQDCDAVTGLCETDENKCPGYLTTSNGEGRLNLSYTYSRTQSGCYSCSPWLATEQAAEGWCAESARDGVIANWSGSLIHDGKFQRYVLLGAFIKTTHGRYSAEYAFSSTYPVTCSATYWGYWFTYGDIYRYLVYGVVGSVAWQLQYAVYYEGPRDNLGRETQEVWVVMVSFFEKVYGVTGLIEDDNGAIPGGSYQAPGSVTESARGRPVLVDSPQEAIPYDYDDPGSAESLLNRPSVAGFQRLYLAYTRRKY